MIRERRFVHYNHVFVFRWNSKRHESFIDFREARALYSFFNEIYLGHIPNNLFNSKDVDKVSQYVLKARSIEDLSLLEKRLLAQGIINIVRGHRLLLEVKEALNRFSRASKETILNYLLIKDPEALAMQVPVWSENKKLVGHIDLVLFDKENNVTIVTEYSKTEKPVKHLVPVIKYMDLLVEQVPAINNPLGIILSKTSLITFRYDRRLEILNILKRVMA
ncbi:MAG: hypothetical protein ACP6IS_05860 [Candidatus Asgardarchaeia archaeon]